MTTGAGADKVLTTDASGVASWQTAAGGSGTVTNFVFTNSTGITGTVATPTITPTLSLALTSAAVGLGNVTNESKATMFTSPTFTGTPAAPTAAAGTNTTQLATTAFVTTAMASRMPSGVIVMWSGTLATIPSGWQLCDGTSGTPDLRDKFIYGTSAGVNPGGTGGSTTHSHTITNREVFIGPTNASSCEIVNNNTQFRIGIRVGGTTVYNRLEWQEAGTKVPSMGEGYKYEYYVVGTDWQGCVDIKVLQLTASSTATSITQLPPYYKLAYIMKL